MYNKKYKVLMKGIEADIKLGKTTIFIDRKDQTIKMNQERIW